MTEPITQLGQQVTISVERMMRYCYLAQMTLEYAPYEPTALKTHVTRFGTMVFETASFLYSLFDDTNNSINLPKVWRGFDHPFDKELEEIVKRLEPFKNELRLVRNRIGFHGSLNRGHEAAGLGIFDVESQRGRDFVGLTRDTQILATKMIKWYIDRMDKSARPDEIWNEFWVELRNHPLTSRGQ
jgi:hypothetical protein